MGKPKIKKVAGQSPALKPPPVASVSAWSGRAPWFGLGLFLLVLLVYWRVLGNDFILFDDHDYVTANLHVQQGLTWSSVKWAFSTWSGSNWHPLTWLAHMLDFQLFGLQPWGHHLTSILLHAINTFLFFWVLFRMTGAVGRSWFVAALFGLHPLHVESVAWVSERKDVLSTMFWLLSLCEYARFVKEPESHRAMIKLFYLLSFVLFALGLMSKPMLVTGPFLLLLLDYWPLRRWERGKIVRLLSEKIPFLLLAVASMAVTFLAQRAGNSVASMVEFPVTLRLENALLSYALYLGKIMYPVNLAIFYPVKDPMPASEVLFAGLVVFGLTFMAFKQRNARPFLFTGWIWFLLTLIPVIGLVQVGQQAMADRYTYVPAVGIFIAASWWAVELLKNVKRQRTLLGSAASIVLLICISTTFRQTDYWKNSGTVFQHAIAMTQDNAVACGSLGDYELQQGRVNQAIELYRKAVRLDPADALCHDQLGAALCKARLVEDGVDQFQQALRISPDFAQAHADLGNALLRKGDPSNAVGEMEKAVQLSPDSVGFCNDLGLALGSVGRFDESIRQLEKCVQSFPNDTFAYIGLGMALGNKGHTDEAVSQYQMALRLDPQNADAHFYLGAALEKLGHVSEAIDQVGQSLKLNPDSAEAHNELGILFCDQMRLNEAVGQFNEAVRLQPAYLDAQANLALALKMKSNSAAKRYTPTK